MSDPIVDARRSVFANGASQPQDPAGPVAVPGLAGISGAGCRQGGARDPGGLWFARAEGRLGPCGALPVLQTPEGCAAEQRPRQQRCPRPAPVGIGLGLEVLHRALSEEGAGPPPAMAAFGQTPATGVFRLLDAGEQGIDVLLPRMPVNPVVGSLACYRFEAGQAWRVGVVRWLSRQDGGPAACGIARLAGQFVPAWAMTPEDKTWSELDASGRRDIFDVVVQQAANGQEHRIFLPRGLYREGQRYLLCLDVNVSHVDIVLTRRVDLGPDFECAGFVAVATESSDRGPRRRSAV